MEEPQKNVIDATCQQEILTLRLNVVSISAMSDIEQITSQFRQAVEQHKPKHLIVDFSQVRFFSSQVLGLLVEHWRKLHQNGGKVAICGINPQLTRVFRITNLDKLFSFYAAPQDAMAALTT